MSESTEKVVPMNDAIEKVTAHFESLATRKREVKEWGLTIYSAPISYADIKKIRIKSDGDLDDMYLYAVIDKALDEAGNRLFTIADKPALTTKADGYIIREVGAWILEHQTEEDAEKNS
tara:strand:- start:1104 stop:1460 length:357 start_codon:yes stop_codon:yes gene_type:complete